MPKLIPYHKKQLQKAIDDRFNAREAYWKSLDDPDDPKAIALIKKVVDTTKYLEDVMKML